jgi:glycosyltransferase involved in cell wall biosynthesis
MISAATVVIPFFNEEHRLNVHALNDFINKIDCCVLLVDDGSFDNTGSILLQLSQNNSKVSVLQISNNGGKANAIRLGILKAIENGSTHVGTSDADLSFSVSDLNMALSLSSRLLNDVTSGARVQLAGSSAKRTAMRQWVGRIIATLVSAITSVPMYDTQSPCKFYLVSEDLRNSLTLRFSTRWFGEAELLMRLRACDYKLEGSLRVKEFVLEDWSDVSGSNLGVKSFFLIVIDLIKLIKSKLYLNSGIR